MRFFLIGIFIGVANMIPGISGGTIALISGVYERLLQAIQSLQIQNMRKIDWALLLPLGGGILVAFLLISHLLYFLLHLDAPSLYAFFFGLIASSSLFLWKRSNIKSLGCIAALVLGGVFSFLLTFLKFDAGLSFGPIGLIFCGMIGAFAMLLPGISGSYLLHLLGVWSLILTSFHTPLASSSLVVLGCVGFGISLGLIIFSRLVHFLLTYFHNTTFAFLIGMMVGGMHTLWPQGTGIPIRSLLFAFFGFFLFILLEMRMKRKSVGSEL